MPLASLTAWRAVISRGQVRPSDGVAVMGIGGGVATFALQIGRLAGAMVIVTSSARIKLEGAGNWAQMSPSTIPRRTERRSSSSEPTASQP